MTESTMLFRLALIPAVFLSIGVGITAAESQPIKRTELHRSDVSAMPGKETVIYIADVMPGAAGGRHTHHGEEYVYILQGTLVVTPDGKQPIILKQGDVSHIAPGDGIHAAKNGSQTEPTKVLVFLVVEKGKPLAEAAK